MQPQITAVPSNRLPVPPQPNVLRVTTRQLSAFIGAWERAVIVPKPDEEAWEGTEIDVRRTVL
ncbi:MAG: hypothetical protein EOP39_17195 [Rubrivivax sp.]|nr:MAG: hypothetical protein EOP39_17195 [Rubrivivax sp.]